MARPDYDPDNDDGLNELDFDDPDFDPFEDVSMEDGMIWDEYNGWVRE